MSENKNSENSPQPGLPENDSKETSKEDSPSDNETAEPESKSSTTPGQHKQPARDESDSLPSETETSAPETTNAAAKELGRQTSPESSAPATSDESRKDQPSKMTSDDSEGEQPEYYAIDDVINKAGYGPFQKVVTFLAGLGWLADAFEIIILSIIGDLLACEWDLVRWQNALLTSIVFGGMALGAPVFGNFADRYGRRVSLAISMLLLFIFGASSAASPDYVWIIVLRGLMGFSLGGLAQGVTLCCEYYPAKLRGRAGFYLSYYWSLGSIGVLASAWIVMKYLDSWRVFVFVASLPALMVFLSMKWFPESARYYLVSNQPEKAQKTLERVTRWNKVEMPPGKLIMTDVVEEKGKILDLLNPAMRRTTLLFWYIWLAIACAYYGVALITPIIVTNGSLIAASKKHENLSIAGDFLLPVECKQFSDRNFFDFLWTTAAEFPGLLVFTFVVEVCDRKIFLGTTCLMTAFMMMFLMLEMEPQIALFFVLFVTRALVAGVFQLLFIMTTEAFPTTLRASAMGTGSGFARFGGFIIPILAQVVVITRPIPSIFVLSAVTALAGVAAFLLPMETRGKSMLDATSDFEG